MKKHISLHRSGVALMMAMLFVALIGTLAVSVASVTMVKTRIAQNQDSAERARANAESGLRWVAWQFKTVQMPQSTIGYIDSDQAVKLWSGTPGNGQKNIVTTIKDSAALMNSAIVAKNEILNGNELHIGPITTADGVSFEIWAKPSPDAKYAGKKQVIQVKSVGTYGTGERRATRTMAMDFLVQKTMRYGVLSKIPIQLGKNTLIEGDVYMAAPPKDNAPPLLSISDFRYTSGTTSDALTTKVQSFQKFLKEKYSGNNNRISTKDTALVSQLSSYVSVSDASGDGYIDEYDLFLQHFGTNGAVSDTAFGSGAPNDPNLFAVIDRGIGKPVNSGDYVRPGYADESCNSQDPYAKVRGTIKVWEDKATLAARVNIAEAMQGAFISADGYSAPVLFGSNASDPSTQISPDDFNMAAFLDLSGASAGTASRPTQVPTPDTSALYANTTIKKADANFTANKALIAKLVAGGTNPVYETKNGVQVLKAITEPVPYGSSDPRSYITRQVFSGVNFKNAIVDRGTNALFVNCTFDGVTFVDGATNMSKSDDKATSLDIVKNATYYANGNNLRFEGSTFTGPIVQGDALATGNRRGDGPADYTDYTNSWEFTGATTFDLDRASLDGSTDSVALAKIKEQATIMAPQTNIEMGSFTAPGAATCSFKGVVVAGCFDVRGTADIDGTIIVPATGAGNVTLGYFGANDNVTNQGQPDPNMVHGSYGRVHIRFNPFRTLPNGINLPVSVLPDPSTWRELIQ